MDLSDASPLCQEGKDLIELDEKDRKIEITVALLLYFKSCLAVYSKKGHSFLTQRSPISHNLKEAHNLHDVYSDTLQLLCVVSRNGESHVDELQLLLCCCATVP